MKKLNLVQQVSYVSPPYRWAKMYAGCVARCPLVSHGEYANETDRQIEGWVDGSRTVTLCLPPAAASVIEADKSRLVRLPAWKQIRPIIIQRRLSWEKPDGKSDWPLLLLRRWRKPTAIVSNFNINNNNNNNEVNKQPHIRMITSYSRWPCITVMCRTIEMT